MEILEIRSSHDLTTKGPRPIGTHAYKLSCRQFLTLYRDWQRDAAARGQDLGLMTLDFERIFISKEESQMVAEAIRATRSPVQLD